MFPSAPTMPASLLHAARAEAVQQVQCAINAFDNAPAVLDLTRGGVLLEAANLLRIGTQHLCQFRIAGESICLPAKVTHTRYQRSLDGPAIFHVGLAFLLLSDQHWAALEKLTSLLGLRAIHG
jgi:hypothetical protein